MPGCCVRTAACCSRFSLDSFSRSRSLRVASFSWKAFQHATKARRRRRGSVRRKNVDRPEIAACRASRMARNLRCRVAPVEGRLAMETFSLDRLGDEIAELSAHLDAATAHLLDLIREFDTREGWTTGFRSCVATPATEERLLAVGRSGTADHVERIVRGWRRVDRKAESAEDSRRHASRALHVYQGDDGMVVLRGRLAPEVGAMLVQALAAAREALYQRARTPAGDAGPAGVSAETPTIAQQQADALGLLAETALHHGIDPGTPGEGYQVVVHVDAPVLADPDAPGQSALEDGTHVSAETSRRLACDASRVVMQHGSNGRVVEVAARTRTIPPRYDERSTTEIGAVAFRAAGGDSSRDITSATGPRAVRLRSRISPCSVVGTTEPCT